MPSFMPRLWLAAAVSAASLAGQPVSDQLNSEFPKWLRIGGEYRARAEGFGNRLTDGADDGYLLHRLRLNVKLTATPWMKFFFQGQDARVFGNDRIPDAPPFTRPMDLRLGYLELGDPDARALGLRAGRQELVYGEQRLVGHTNWTNTARSFDAVRLTARHAGYRVDVFAASVVNLAPAERFSRPQAGNNLHGIYGGMEKLVPQAVIEPYVLWRLQPRVRAETGAVASLDFKTGGVRWVGKLPAGFDYGAEMAVQRGALSRDDVRAWAGHWVLGYTVRKTAWKPRASAEYNYATGDKDARDGVRGTFDSLYPTAHDKYGLCDQVGWRNIHDVRFGVEAKPAKKLSVMANYHNWWLASATDWLYNASGSPLLRRADGSAGTHVGEETDLEGAWTVSKQMTISGGVGRIFAGGFLKKTAAGRGYTFPFLMLTWAF